MTDTMNFQPLGDYDHPHSPYCDITEEIPFRFGRNKKIHRQMTKGEVYIQKAKDNLNKLYPRK